MFTAIPVPSFSAKITAGRECGLFLLSAANSNSRGTQFTRRPGNESEEALSNGHHDLQGAGQFEPIGAAAMRVLQSVKKKAGRKAPGEEVRNLPASKTAQRVGGRARRSGVS